MQAAKCEHVRFITRQNTALILYVDLYVICIPTATFGRPQNDTRKTISSYSAPIIFTNMWIDGESFILIDQLQQKIFKKLSRIFCDVRNYSLRRSQSYANRLLSAAIRKAMRTVSLDTTLEYVIDSGGSVK